MFGKNPVRKKDHGTGSRLWVQEIFYTIQGEGPATGTPAVFIRLAGCNLRCWFCDTDFESSDWKPTLPTIENEVWHQARHGSGVERPETIRLPIVVLTGGEPLRQNVIPLITRLNETGFAVHIETAGTLFLEGLHSKFYKGNPHGNLIVVSPKTSVVHGEVEKLASAFKYVIRAGDPAPTDPDTKNSPSTQIKGKMAMRLATPTDERMPIFIAPMDEYDGARNEENMKHCVSMCLHKGYRISIQTHKIMGLR